MGRIGIAQVKAWREEIGATHLVVFAIGSDGTQHVATHGETEQNAREAAGAGNRLKKSLGWPKGFCMSEALARICRNCTYYKADRGIHCANGWTGDRSRGHCYFDTTRPRTGADDKCHNFEPSI